MGRNLANRKKIVDLIGCALVAWALGCSLTMVLVSALSLAAPFAPVAVACALVTLLCALALVNRPCALLAGGAALATAVVLARTGGFGRLRALADALVRLGAGGEAALSEHALTAAVLLGVLLTLTIFWMARMSGGVYPALTLSLILILGSWFLENRIEPLYAVMAVAALATMFARAADEKVSYMRAVPVGVIAALIALMLLPGGRLTWAPLENAAQKVRDLFSDYFLFTEPRTTYSISSDGFQPMGELLGGPAEPLLDDVMLVETDRPLLLRGAVKRTYTTYSWTETAVNSRYVFIDPTRRGLRDQVFDADRQPSFIASGAFERIDADVTMLHEGISALFVPHGLDGFSAPVDLVTYFSTSGEVFITRGVQPGDHYAFSAAVPADDTSRMRELTYARAGRGDDRLSAALKGYTALPQGIEQGVYTLAQQITQNASTPYDKALAIQNHLISNYTYSLDVPYPPQGRDFVSYFLLDGKQGYCSYFATAMAVMGRMAGLPTRYVEGYLVPTRAGGATVVTGKNAHAWVEVYFEGVGWVAFNPTPGSGDSYQAPRGGGEQGSGLDQSEPDDGVPDDGGEPEATPTPPPEDGDQAGGEDPEEAQPDEQDDDQTEGQPEDQPEDQPDDQPDEDPWADEDEQGGADGADGAPDLRFLWWLLLLVPVLGLSIWVTRRLRATDPGRTGGRHVKGDDRLMIWYRALLLALEQQGQMPAAGETPAQFAARLKSAGLVGDAFTEAAKQVTLNRYAARRIDDATFRQAQAAYEQLVKQLKPTEKARWIAHRVLRGLGDPLRIP